MEVKESLEKITSSINTIVDDKTAELSKHNRQLNSKLQSLKTEHKKLEQVNNDLQKDLDDLKQQPPAPQSTEYQSLSDKFEKTSKKTSELLSLNAQLKNELKMAQKCLYQEIGAEVNVAQLLAGQSNWRGRAQQISMLNTKMVEMKEKLDSSFKSFDEGSRSQLCHLESVRRQEIESLSKEMEEYKAQLDDVKQKVAASKARNKNLSDDANSYKLKTLEFMEKSARDEETMKRLNDQIAMTKFECNHKLNEMRGEIEQMAGMKQDADYEVEKIKCQFANQEELINKKENEANKLKLEIDRLEGNLRDLSSDFLFSCRQMSKDDYMSVLKNLEDEKNNVLDYMQQLNERLDKESVKVSEQHDVMSKQRLKISRLEAKVREFEQEKEAANKKNQRSLRISEYTRARSNSSLVANRPATNSSGRLVAEIDQMKFK